MMECGSLLNNLSATRNDHSLCRLTAFGAALFDLLDNVHATSDYSENDVPRI